MGEQSAENQQLGSKQRIRADLATAMKAKDTLTTGTLRMILAAIGAEEVSGKQARELGDDEIVTVLTREKKKRAESARVFADNGRHELADKERAESEVISRYLPTKLGDDEVATIVDSAIAQVTEETGEAPGMRQMGQVMKVATGLAAGGADGKRLSTAVRARLR
ncbi:GatB/YqeY domain-containing protein [Williamsia sterculiae]|uniref:GatB/YqeY domain-containing protein n=1 Tax=Williamsia sterculiae TaxID=1344003 RepID=A0A1N7F4W7_9NOCA|nr:GatB/YqeY domain-containing protein [Williamsia sterculiae]SIR95302.1 hypothetical protein SAMN05445060_1800 [Williamsia sterculiae]